MAYEPRSQAYGSQQAQRRPPQPNQRQMYHEQYDNQQQGYDDGYWQDQYRNDQNGYARRWEATGYDNSYDNGYNNGYDNGYNNGYPQQSVQQNGQQVVRERQYDPRYQQRPPRGPPQPQDSGLQQRMRPIEVNQGTYQAPPEGRPRPPQIPNGPIVLPANRRETREIQSASLISPPASQPANVQNAKPMFQRPPQEYLKPQSASSKLSMAEWKEREKARMHADMMKPEVLAQDNAFPAFPGWGKNDSRPNSRGGANSASGVRKSEDTSRPNTAQGAHSRNTHKGVQDGNRPGTSNGPDKTSPGNAESVGSRSPPQRPPLDHKPRSYDHRVAQPAQPWIQEPQLRYSADEPRRPPNGRPQPGTVEPHQDAQSSSSSFEYQQATGYAAQHQKRENPRYREPQAAGTVYYSQHQMQRGPEFTDANSVRQAKNPSPPSNASQPSRTLDSTSPPYSQNPTSNYEGAYVPPRKAWAEMQQAEHDSLGDVHNDYRDGAPPLQQVQQVDTAPKSREDEIEAEMPDFDSAAPNQTSILHKRTQTIEKHLNGGNAAPSLAPPMPLMPQHLATQSAPTLPVSDTAPASRSRPTDQLSHIPQEHNGGGFAFGFEEQTPRPEPYGHPNVPPVTANGGYVPSQNRVEQRLPHRPQNYAPRPPFAQDQPRRSMDDTVQGRRMHQGQRPLPTQRFYANGQQARGPVPAHMHRPDIDRNYSGQTIWSEPGGEARGRNLPASVAVPPKAPIEAQSLLQPAPETQYGAPLTQQRSAPEPSSNPDTLPHHPVPVRPGLLEQHVPQPAKPVPVRQHDNVSPSAREQRMSATASLPDTPVTHAELDQLRRYVTSNPQNPKQALVLVKKLVEASNVLSSDNGRLDPKSTAKNREKYIVEAHKRLKKLASAGFPDAMFYMAECHGQGSLGLEADTKEAFNFYLAAAKQGHAQAAYRTAVCCEIGPEEGGGTRKDPQKALQWYKRAAVLGDPAGMFKVGIICLKGLMGQPRNVGEGVTWLKRAVDHADNDNPHALHELANLHDPASQTDPEIRSKVVPDENYARELFARAAKLGYKQSQFRLGQANEYGSLGFAIDNRASISWYSKAAAQGEHQAELALSGWYLTGAEGILKNSDTEAYLWARKAACSEPPLAKAMFAMGYFSEMGIGCPKSIEEARRWYGRAAAHKFPKAIERIEELKKAGSRSGSRPQPTNGKLTRKDQKKDEAECVVM